MRHRNQPPGDHQARGRIAKTLVSVGIAAALATAGCSAPASQGGGASKSATGPSLLVAADNGSPTFTQNFNPFSSSKRTMATVIYEPLFVINTLDGTFNPFLGTAYTQPDPTQISVTLRENVKWSDGQAFSADDVAFTYQLLKDKPELDTTGVWQRLSSVETSNNTVTFHLKGADVPAAFVVLEVPIVPKHIWSSQSDPVTWTNDNPVGTGPYTLGQFTPNQYTLNKNPNYWQADKVAASQLVLPASNTQLELVNKKYDWAYAYISDVENTWVKATPGNTYWFPPGGTVSLLPNLTKAPFNDLNFRQGLSLALDRKKIADIAEEGYVQPASQAGLLLPNQKEWLDPSLPNGGAVSQDLNGAAAAFAKAGYTNQGGKLVGQDGKPLTMSLTTPNGWTDWLRGAQEVQRQLQAVGITVNLQQPQPAAYFQAQSNGDFDLIMGAFGGTGSLFTDFNNLLSSEFVQPVGSSASANYQRFSDPKVDAVLADLRVALDKNQQQKDAYQLQQTVYNQLPVISLFYGGLWGLFSTAQFEGWPSADNPYASPATWGANPLLILTHITAKKS